ncbi:MAG: hypothetical protein OXG38_01890, partial [Chloroflexi bacterium]|nr:hypothetical protein [Chloroflexota bacterium]
AWMTYAFTGCSGTIPAGTGASVGFGDLPNLGGTSLTAPIRHALWQLTPVGWTGVTEPEQGFVRAALPGTYTRDIQEARKLDRWREPTVPEGWTFWYAGRETDVTPYGYEAAWGTEDGYLAFILQAEEYWYDARLVPGASSANDPAVLAETRTIGARPAIITYSPPGPNHQQYYSILLRVYDPSSNTMYTMFNFTPRLSGSNIEAVIAIAESLFRDGGGR